jgi:hypothetical protein
MKHHNIVFAEARRAFHKALVSGKILAFDESGVASNADRKNDFSRAIAKKIATALGAETVVKKGKGQTAGAGFECAVADFVSATFPHLQNLRPGNWTVMRLGNKSKVKTADFAQYEHLFYLAEAVRDNPKLQAALGNDYLVSPDVIVSRGLCEDSEINALDSFVDDTLCKKADLRKSNGGRDILHASISAKWTMRSDRAQNSRTEALNLMRDRKGRVPHIMVVTAEPSPSRIASLALGTGDIDCVYHFALYELLEAVGKCSSKSRDEAMILLNNMIDGKRLKDISDLPLDLAC